MRRPAERSSCCCRRSGACSAAERTSAQALRRSTARRSRWARAIARELGIDLVAGSVAERIEGEPKLRNTCVHVGPDGEIAATYRKIHLFDVEVEGTVYRESDHEEPGDEPVLSRTADGVPVGLSVCYDVRFPELYRVLAVEGARILTVPAAFTVPTTRDHWEVLLRARAIENQCFVIAANQIGEHVPGLRVRRALDDRRSVGARAGARPRHGDRDHRRPRLRAAGRHPQPPARRWPGAGPRPTRGCRRRPDDGHAQRPAGRREAPPDPRRRGPRLRPAGLPHLPRLGHRRRGRSRLRTRLPLLPLQGRGARHALPGALERAARGDPRGRRAGRSRPATSSTRSPRSSSTPTATTPS